MTSFRCSFVFFLFALSTIFASAQRPAVQADRIAAEPDLRATTILPGHVPAWAVSANDRGAIPPESSLRLTFVLSRSPELQTSFTQLLADQQNPNSASYHQWLTPQQVGERYGPTQHDLDAFTGWLSSQGFSIIETARSGVFVVAVAPASTVSTALATSFHSFNDNGEPRRAPTADPTIPAAFASVVHSISGLADTAVRPMSHGEPVAISAQPGVSGSQPQFTNSSNGNHYVTPADFATIFDLKAAYNAGYTGSGQKVAIIGRSRVVTTDITEFESKTGLATNVPNVVIPPNGVDPGVTSGDGGEATLDVERVVGTAPGAQMDLVITSSASGGIETAAQYEVQTLLDPIMNISFGSCEVNDGASGVSFWDGLFSQAASEGISVFVSAADSGAATCDTQFGTPEAYQFRSINYICASSYATCVGGTEFADTANPAQFWGASNGANLVSALGYIPEGAWNEPRSGPYVVASGGGGASIYVAKPAWQTGVGVPADNARDVPDVSFPSASHDGYWACYAAGGGDCGSGYFEYFSGTSGAAPGMAGVAALLNQKLGGAQGNLNPLLYRLAASSPGVFHDATPASSGVAVCDIGVASMCNNSTPSATSLLGGLAGFALTTGYDQATGLGSLDVANFLNAATNPKSTLASTTLAVKESASTISDTQTEIFTATLSSKIAGTPTGTVQFYADGNTLGGPVALVSGQAVTVATPFPAAGSYLITATYSGDGTYASTTAPGIPLTVTGLAATTQLTAFGPGITGVSLGVGIRFSAAIIPSSGTTVPTGTVRFYAPGSTGDQYLATVPVAGGSAVTPVLTFSKLGNYTLTAEYSGDAVYSPSNSVAIPFSVVKLPSVTQISATAGNIGTGGSKNYTVSIESIFGTTLSAPSGTVQLYSNGVVLGAPVVIVPGVNQSSQVVSLNSFPTAGTYSITAVYSGDANWMSSSSSNAISLTVLPTPASYQTSVTAPALSFAAGASSGNIDTVTVTGVLGFGGTVNLSCSIAYNGSAVVQSAPTCSPANGSLSVKPDSAAPALTFTILSIASGSSYAGGEQPYNGWRRSGHFGGAAFCALLLCFVPLGRRSWRRLAIFLMMTAGFGSLIGCSSGKSSGGTLLPGTTPGSYTVTITASTTSPGVAVPPPVTVALTIN